MWTNLFFGYSIIEMSLALPKIVTMSYKKEYILYIDFLFIYFVFDEFILVLNAARGHQDLKVLFEKQKSWVTWIKSKLGLNDVFDCCVGVC